jgi:hypothetical protein
MQPLSLEAVKLLLGGHLCFDASTFLWDEVGAMDSAAGMRGEMSGWDRTRHWVCDPP